MPLLNALAKARLLISSNQYNAITTSRIGYVTPTSSYLATYCSIQPFRVFAPAQHSLQDWYEKKGREVRFPTLPRTLKTEVGINGKSR
ncbi:hypothetical protein F511_40676 [Dorcoceras hygrometricum]|uniref:Uncharacterized protein n=1 Tax=Dorcoceras hygrometricum TaxID=472368 RepID=A0A2Z7CD82_9LAMI|nr:hypothetical protein F511_40676 [Dorcoceras hygrometricum]